MTVEVRNGMMHRLLMLATRNRARIITCFKIFYLFLLVYLLVGSRSIYKVDSRFLFFYQSGVWAGRTALIFYILTTIPGVFRRFGLQYNLVSILMIFRRYTGQTMYLLALMHYLFVRGIATLLSQGIEFSQPLFQLFGLTALLLTTPLFLTSNDIAVKILGKWWGRFHKLTYIIIAFIFLHVALQRLSFWSLLIGSTLIAQFSSHIYHRVTSRG